MPLQASALKAFSSARWLPFLILYKLRTDVADVSALMQLLENANEYIIHGYAYRDWIRSIPNPQFNVGKYGPVGGNDLNRAMSVIYNEVPYG